jgi:hypothetical protein
MICQALQSPIACFTLREGASHSVEQGRALKIGVFPEMSFAQTKKEKGGSFMHRLAFLLGNLPCSQLWPFPIKPDFLPRIVKGILPCRESSLQKGKKRGDSRQKGRAPYRSIHP